jgi:trimethylamine-N-oxide reductase cytochrome c-type subunit TorC|nr:NapC/NirT family cytochrome c [uncultured Rhodopila sp.]
MQDRTQPPLQPAKAPTAAAAVLFGLCLGLAAWGGWTALGARIDRDTACLSCHIDNVATGEPAHIAHLSNKIGLRARCADCHAGESWPARLQFLTRHAADVAGFLGHITDTPEQQDAHQLALASRVWANMEADSSAACRSCHAVAMMDLAKLSTDAANGMRASMKPGASCVSCHKGVMHKLPTVTTAWLTRSLADLAAASRPAAGARGMTVGTRKLFLQPDGIASGQGEATVLPGVDMEVLEAAGGNLQVRLSGWQTDNAPRAVYAAKGQHILTASLTPAAVAAAVRSEDSATDPDTQLVWRRVTLTGWIDSGGLATAPDAVWSVVQTVYGALCASCHAAPSPSVHNPNQWIGVMSAKRKLLPLDDDGNRLLLRFLQLRAQESAHAG